ncbi:MAG: sigma-70 family RNA polymerase sigma factor [bacterium]
MIADPLPPFDECYRRLFHPLTVVAHRVLRDEALAQDVAQEALTIGIRQHARFVPQGLGAFAAYLRTVARNRALEVAKQRGRAPLSGDPASDPGPRDGVSAGFGGTLDLEGAELARIARTALDDDEYLILALTCAGMSRREVEACTGVARATVQDIHTRALRKVRLAAGVADAAEA